MAALNDHSGDTFFFLVKACLGLSALTYSFWCRWRSVKGSSEGKVSYAASVSRRRGEGGVVMGLL